MKTTMNEKGELEDKLNIFDKIDRKLEGHKLYDFYYKHIWGPIYRIFYFRPKTFFHNIRLFFQRGKRGYTQEDYWCLNYYLAKYLAGVLYDWAENAHSYPPELSGKNIKYEEWVFFLKDSADAFKQYIKLEEEVRFADEKEYKIVMKKIKRFFQVLGDNYQSFWD